MKIYTRTGDTGMTSLANGQRVPKHDERVDLYGTVDELNSAIGLAVSLLAALPSEEASVALMDELRSEQSLLFDLGSELAGFSRQASVSVIVDDDISALEAAIDRMDAVLSPLKSFILPGGIPAAAQLHVARTICRRVERQMTALRAEKSGQVHDTALIYANRLSDYLFAAARYANHLGGATDISWRGRQRGGPAHRTGRERDVSAHEDFI